MGLLEFLEWCEDMNAEPVLAVYAGYSLAQDRVKAGSDLEPFVKEALDEIEYVIGDTNTVWGARRAQDGHPAPFKVTYVEIGNKDGFDQAKTYDARYAQIADAIRAKYPQLKLISTIPDANVVNFRDPHKTCVIFIAHVPTQTLRMHARLVEHQLHFLQLDRRPGAVDSTDEIVDEHVLSRHQERHYRVYPVHPRSSKSYRTRKLPSGTKTDRRDCWALADALRLEEESWRVQADGKTEGGKWRIATVTAYWPGGGNAGKPGQGAFSKNESTEQVKGKT